MARARETTPEKSALTWEEYIDLMEERRHDPIPDDSDTEHMFHVIDGEWFGEGRLEC